MLLTSVAPRLWDHLELSIIGLGIAKQCTPPLLLRLRQYVHTSTHSGIDDVCRITQGLPHIQVAWTVIQLPPLQNKLQQNSTRLPVRTHNLAHSRVPFNFISCWYFGYACLSQQILGRRCWFRLWPAQHHPHSLLVTAVIFLCLFCQVQLNLTYETTLISTPHLVRFRSCHVDSKGSMEWLVCRLNEMKSFMPNYFEITSHFYCSSHNLRFQRKHVGYLCNRPALPHVQLLHRSYGHRRNAAVLRILKIHLTAP
mmetsp:Transcript_93160/g.170978  ORF Transcript_93160/g.170978 Transcript_93160/m.170978 type:complete len:254 (+) Transcript_93160:174-935(+)